MQTAVGYFCMIRGMQDIEALWTGYRITPFGLPNMYNAVDDLSNGLLVNLGPALDRFAALVESAQSGQLNN